MFDIIFFLKRFWGGFIFLVFLRAFVKARSHGIDVEQAVDKCMLRQFHTLRDRGMELVVCNLNELVNYKSIVRINICPPLIGARTGYRSSAGPQMFPT